MHPPRRARPRRRYGRWIRRRLSLIPLIAVLVGWPASFFIQGGFGLLNLSQAARAWGPAAGSSCFEVSLIRGGLLVVINGTRTDSIYPSDIMSGSMSIGWPVYLLLME